MTSKKSKNKTIQTSKRGGQFQKSNDIDTMVLDDDYESDGDQQPITTTTAQRSRKSPASSSPTTSPNLAPMTTRSRAKKELQEKLQQQDHSSSSSNNNNNSIKKDQSSPPMTRARSKQMANQKISTTTTTTTTTTAVGTRRTRGKNPTTEKYSDGEKDNEDIQDIDHSSGDEDVVSSNEEYSSKSSRSKRKKKSPPPPPPSNGSGFKRSAKRGASIKKMDVDDEQDSDQSDDDDDENDQSDDQDYKSSRNNNNKNSVKRKPSKQQTKKIKKKSRKTTELYSSEEEQSEEESQEEQSDEEEERSDSDNDSMRDSDDEQEEKEEFINDTIEDMGEEVIEKILAARVFKGKFVTLPTVLSKYINFASSTLLSPVLGDQSSTPTIPIDGEPDDQSPNGDKKDEENSSSSSSASSPPPPSTSKNSSPPLQPINQPPSSSISLEVSTNATNTTTNNSSIDNSSVSDEETRYLTLLKNRSYRSVKWMTLKELESTKTNPKLPSLIKKAVASPIKDESEANPIHYFKQDYIQIDKVLSKEIKKKGGRSGQQSVTVYLVKWRDLPHEKSTWEPESSLKSPADKAAIQDYLHIQEGAGGGGVSGGSKKVARPNKLPAFAPSLVPRFKGTLALKEFQVEGFLWLSYNWYHDRSSLLADEMGLGKTIQTIAFVQYLSQSVGIKGPFLIVAPLSTLGNWQKEILKWTDMKVLVFYGSQETRSFQKKYEWKRKDKSYQFEILLTTYETVMAEHPDIVKVHWRALVLDEGHRIKNVNSKVLSKLKSIRTEHSVILTGTPLQNDMKELWTMLNFLDPSKFNSCTDFLAEFSDLKEESQVTRLHQILSPYLLRRMKEDVELSIPIKEETVIQVELSSIQKTYYRAILEKNREFLARGVKSKSNLPKLTNIMIQIRKVCNHPFLIPGAEDTIIRQEKIKTDEQIAELLIRSSSKLVLVDKLLQRLKVEGHRVLIFSQMVESLNILEDYLHYREYPYERLDGSVKSEYRQASIERFMDKESDRFVFLLSTRSGGVGINLTSADTVILFDSDWNPQSDLQAQARCHRIGQTSNVKVYRLITRNTYEQYLFEVATKKLLLDHIVLNNAKNNPMNMNSVVAEKKEDDEKKEEEETVDEKKEEEEQDPAAVDENSNSTSTTATTNNPASNDTPSEISQMLKYGAAYLFNENQKDASDQDNVMFNEDIDKILERSTTISFDNKNKPSNLSGFSKATFASNENDMNVDLDDENFWEKVLPDYKTVKQLEEKLSNGSIFNNDEARAKYIDDIVTLAQSKKDDVVDSISVEFIADLLKLIMRVEFNTKFSVEEREKVQSMRMLLERPRTRKRVIPEVVSSAADREKKKKNQPNSIISMPDSDSSSEDNNSDTDFVQDENEAESDESGLDSRPKEMKRKYQSLAASTTGLPQPLSALVPVWNKSNKDKLKTTLFKYGFLRWKKVQKEMAATGGINKSTSEIQSISESFLEVSLKHQPTAMKEFFDSFLDDTSNFNWHKIGFDIESPIVQEKDSNLIQFQISEVNNNIPLITTQSITINFKKLPKVEEMNQEVKEQEVKDEVVGEVQVKKDESNEQSKTLEEKQNGENNIVVGQEEEEQEKVKEDKDKEVLDEKVQDGKIEITKEELKVDDNSKIELEEKQPIKKEIDGVKNDDNNVDNNQNNNINNNNQSSSLSNSPIHELPILTNRNPYKEPGYYLVLYIEDKDQLIRVYPIHENMKSLEMFFPGFNGNYITKIIYTNPLLNQYYICSNEIKIITTPNIIWQQLDFPTFATRIQTILSRLMQMRSLRQLVVTYGKHLTNLRIPQMPRGPTGNWTSENDRNLLIGIYRYGYGKYNEVFADPSLELLPKKSLSSSTNSNMIDEEGNMIMMDGNSNNNALLGGEKIPSSESLRRRVSRITDVILKSLHAERQIKLQRAQLKDKQLQQQHHQQQNHHNNRQQQSMLQYQVDMYDDNDDYSSHGNNNVVGNRRPFSPDPIDSDSEEDRFHQINNNKSMHESREEYLEKLKRLQHQHHQPQQQQQQQRYQDRSYKYPKQQTTQSSSSYGGRIDQMVGSRSSHIPLYFQWNGKSTSMSVPPQATLDVIKKMFIVRLNLTSVVGSNGESKDSVLRFYHKDKAIVPQYNLLEIGVKENDVINVLWESKWKTIQVSGFEHEGVLMKVQDDTVLEDIVKAYFHSIPPPYEYKNLRIELGTKILDLNTDIGGNRIKNDSHLKIVSSPDIIHVHVVPSWNTSEKEIYALHKRTTLLSKLIDSFLKKHNLQPKQIVFSNSSTHHSIDPQKTPIEQNIEMDTQIVAYLLLSRLDVTYNNTSIPYLLSTNTSFDSLMQRFCERVNINKSQYQFVYNNKPLVADENPDSIKMGPHAVIQVQPIPSIIEVEVRLVGQDAGSYIKMHTHNPFPLHILMDKFCQEHKLNRRSVLFKYNGVKVNPNDTLTTIGLKDSDVIECYTN